MLKRHLLSDLSGTLVEIGSTAFGGYAQLALPVVVALYWPNTTRRGMLAGIGGSQLFYLVHVFVPATTVGGVTVFGSTYLTWDFALYGMVLSLVLTVGVSLVTAPDADERTERFSVGAGAD